jgi:hypothetical protein
VLVSLPAAGGPGLVGQQSAYGVAELVAGAEVEFALGDKVHPVISVLYPTREPAWPVHTATIISLRERLLVWPVTGRA